MNSAGASSPRIGCCHDRLVEQYKLPFSDGLPQVGLKAAAGLNARIHLGLEEPVQTTPIDFRSIMSQVRISEQRVAIGPVVGRECDADAQPNHHLMTLRMLYQSDHSIKGCCATSRVRALAYAQPAAESPAGEIELTVAAGTPAEATGEPRMPSRVIGFIWPFRLC